MDTIASYDCICSFDAVRGKCVSTLKTGVKGESRCFDSLLEMSFISGSRHVCCAASSRGSVFLWDLRLPSRRPWKELTHSPAHHPARIHALAVCESAVMMPHHLHLHDTAPSSSS